MLEGSEILFVGIGASSPFWYRCALPAIYMGADWVGVRGQPPAPQIVTGLVHGDTALPHYDDYRLVIFQQVAGTAWLKQINALRKRGIKVLYEVDDYLHGVAKQKGHDYARFFTKERVAAYELCMRACDGIVCSTPYLARRYAKFNRRVYICRNGIDITRYALTRPERPTVNIGWAGATGHISAIVPWLNPVAAVMREHEHTTFVSIGQPFAEAMKRLVGDTRALTVPFCQLECYPAAMCMFDIALAPATDAAWYRAKSDLRWLEASALGIPTIGDRRVYPDIDPGVTGDWADSPAEVAAILDLWLKDPELRQRLGERARDHVREHRTIDVAAAQWFEVCAAVVGEYESASQLRRAP